ncbi:hypothetical protein M3Y95_01190900 [Aphelenchoides besseyi]|nr:hypothetical protein M3Y95_01190900 [Aphelenchoides besseyi]
MSNDTELLETVVEDCTEACGNVLEVLKEVSEDVSRLQRRNDCAWLGERKDDLVAFTSGLRELMSKMVAGNRIDMEAAEERFGELQEILNEIRPQVLQLTTRANRKNGAHKNSEDLDDESVEESENDDEEVGTQTDRAPKYQTPKMVPIPMDEHEEERRLRRIEKARKRAMQSSLIQDLQSQHSDAPTLITDQPRMSKLEAERIRFEENNYTRLHTTKREKQLMRKRENQGTLDSLLKFGDYMAMDTVLENGGAKSKKRKGRPIRRNVSNKKFKKSVRHRR